MKNIRNFFLFLLLAASGAVYGASPKYVFYFIGDGMGVGQVQALRTYYKNTGDADRDLQHFYQFPVAGIMTTYSADNDITDSAAAGTALACGTKTRNGMLGMDADTVALTSIAYRMKQAGRGVAVMSSVGLDDATPGSFYAFRPNRGQYYEIARQGAASNFDFLAGAYFRDPYGVRANTRGNVFAEYEANGYMIVRGKEGYEEAVKADARRVLWLDADTTSENTIDYAIDARGKDMTLPQMVAAGIDFLYKHYPKGFFMMAEGGAIDHLAHGNDAAGVIRETKEFDAAIREAFEFYSRHPKETLIIVTADHETGGLGMGVNGSRKPLMEYVAGVQVSKNCFGDAFRRSVKVAGEQVSWSDARKVLAEQLGLGTTIALTAGEEGHLMQVFQETVINKRGKGEHTLYADFDGFTAEVFKLYSRKLGVGWTTNHHTGNPVPLFAIGAGADKFVKVGWLDNTDIPRLIGEACRVK